MSDPSPDALTDAIEQGLVASSSSELDELVARTPAEAFQRALAVCRGRNRARHEAAMLGAGPTTANAQQNLLLYYAREAELDALRDNGDLPK